jgi:Rrf2 family protein
MSLIFSKQCEYAIQAILYIALKPSKEMTSIKELTQKLDIPYHFLGKILQRLALKKILISMKGPTGGFALGKPAKEISLLSIVEAIDGIEFATSCIMGFTECSGQNPCAVHDQWADLREDIKKMLSDKNILEMAKEMKKPGYKSIKH